MINIIAIFMISTSLGLQPQVQVNKHPLVEILPSKTYVFCIDNCNQPTPKVKKTIIKRTEDENKQNTYSPLTEYIKQQKEKQELNVAAKEDNPVVISKVSEKPAIEETIKPIKKPQKAHSIKKTGFKKIKAAHAGVKVPAPVVAEENPDIVTACISANTPEPVVNEISAPVTNFVEEEKKGMAETVYFSLNSSVLSKKEMEKLNEWLKRVKADHYTVLGYNCPISGEMKDRGLSVKRAEAVRNLILKEQKNAVVVTQGMGRSELFSQKDSKLNRRVNIVAKGKKITKDILAQKSISKEP